MSSPHVPDARATCPHCSLMLFRSDADRTIYHQHPVCDGFAKMAAAAGAKETGLAVFDPTTGTYTKPANA